MAEKVVIGNAELWYGDSLEVLREWQERRFDAVITDPPYSSGGMVLGAGGCIPVTAYHSEIGRASCRERV